jgi:hypothetical protein
MSDSKFRLVQYQTNDLSNPKWRKHAGDWGIEWKDDLGRWQDYDGPYAAHEKSTAQKRFESLQRSELPQLFED